MKFFKSFLTGFFLFITGIFLLITCKKEYSYEGGPLAGTAVYVFEGAGDTCSGSILNGGYYAGTPAGGSNTIELQVRVAVPGTYVVATELVDGISFTASGSFTDTGRQVMILTAVGTPLQAGSFDFSTPGTLGCSFTVVVNKPVVIQAGFSLDGAPGACTNIQIGGQYTAGTTLDATNTLSLNVTVNSPGAYSITTDTLDGIYFSKTGTFTTTGDQTITLTGSGTPPLARDLVFTPSGDSSSCSIPLTVLNPEPLAIYVLESGYGTTSSPCIYTVSGNYTTGTSLNTTDSVSIHVAVLYAGNYTIATNTINGMTFSFTGTFQTLGEQIVTLTGSGTPQKSGSFLFTPQIVGPHPRGGQACTFVITIP